MMLFHASKVPELYCFCILLGMLQMQHVLHLYALRPFFFAVLMVSCTENWASVSEGRQSQLLSLKPLFKVCKSQQIFKNLSISFKIYFKVIMPVGTKKCEAWMTLGDWGEPCACACVAFPTLQQMLSSAPSPVACSCLQRQCYSFQSILFNLQLKLHFYYGTSFYLSSNWSLN